MVGVPDDADHVIEAEGRGPRLRARAWPLGAVVRGHTSAGEGRAADVVSRPRLGHRAHPRGRRRDRRPQPQELPRPVLRRDPHTPTRSVHGESRAVQRPAGMAVHTPRRVPDPTRRVRREALDTAAAILRPAVSSWCSLKALGRAARRARRAASRRRPPGDRDRCPDRPGGDHGHVAPVARRAPEAQESPDRVSSPVEPLAAAVTLASELIDERCGPRFRRSTAGCRRRPD